MIINLFNLMDKSRSNKRNRNRKQDEDENGTNKKEMIDETSDKYILKKFLDKNIEELNSAELKKLKIYIDEIRALLKNKDNQNVEGLVKLAEANVKILLQKVFFYKTLKKIGSSLIHNNFLKRILIFSFFIICF